MAFGFRRTAKFSGTPDQVRELCALESAVDDALRRVDESAGRWTVSPVARHSCTASLGGVLLYDPSLAGFDVSLAPPSVSSRGECLVLKRVTPSVNNVVVRVLGGRTIDGAASLTLSTAYGATRILSDGSNYWTL